jgi:outer membrane protein OmpA-like peptidoglycan-associated protein
MKALVLATLLCGAACNVQPSQSPVAGLTEPIHTPKAPDLGHYPSRVEYGELYHIYLGEPVHRACAGPTPYFDFDSTKATTEDHPTMQTLVTCMITGPLAGKSILLVGHTDPRGTAAYNAKLGLERAERVKTYLVTNGVDRSRVQIVSDGSEDASPYPKDWPTDRRVGIQLAAQ